MMSVTAPMYRFLLLVMLFLAMGSPRTTDLQAQTASIAAAEEGNLFARSLVGTGDFARLQQALAKARRQEPVTVAVIGTSITQGALASRPTIEVTVPQTVITQSCRVVIPPGKVIEDATGQGVILIGAPNIEIEFDGASVVRGSLTNTSPDEYRGYGIRLNGQAGVTIRGARISGF